MESWFWLANGVKEGRLKGSGRVEHDFWRLRAMAEEVRSCPPAWSVRA